LVGTLFKTPMPTILKIKQSSLKLEKTSFQEVDKFYHSTAWRTLTRNHRKEHPFCQYCLPDIISDGYATDHTLPRLLFPELALHKPNLKTICKKCDGRKRLIESKTKDREVMIKLLTDAGFYKG
jgi:5-methylcytosine-specific restriction endonuclease McrA